ncbi:EFTS factor, partial [Atractosteus spatula]|nr:EFTS factor [Atractosteus spatula]
MLGPGLGGKTNQDQDSKTLRTSGTRTGAAVKCRKALTGGVAAHVTLPRAGRGKHYSNVLKRFHYKKNGSLRFEARTGPLPSHASLQSEGSGGCLARTRSSVPLASTTAPIPPSRGSRPGCPADEKAHRTGREALLRSQPDVAVSQPGDRRVLSLVQSAPLPDSGTATSQLSQRPTAPQTHTPTHSWENAVLPTPPTMLCSAGERAARSSPAPRAAAVPLGAERALTQPRTPPQGSRSRSSPCAWSESPEQPHRKGSPSFIFRVSRTREDRSVPWCSCGLPSLSPFWPGVSPGALAAALISRQCRPTAGLDGSVPAGRPQAGRAPRARQPMEARGHRAERGAREGLGAWRGEYLHGARAAAGDWGLSRACAMPTPSKRCAAENPQPPAKATLCRCVPAQLNLLPVFWQLTAYSDGVASHVCEDGEHLVVSEGQPDRCCGYCSAGDHQVVLRNCSYFSDALCGCQDGYEMHNDTGKCQKKNGDHQVIFKTCSNFSDALCGCQDGHKMRNSTVQCQKKNMFHDGTIVLFFNDTPFALTCGLSNVEPVMSVCSVLKAVRSDLRKVCLAQPVQSVHSGCPLLATEKALLVKLRKVTGYSFVNCKKALEKFDGDFAQAESWLHEQAQKEGWSKANKLQGRRTSQGLIGQLLGDRTAVMVEVNCETDFVARNETFQQLVHRVALATMGHHQSTAGSGSGYTKVCTPSEVGGMGSRCAPGGQFGGIWEFWDSITSLLGAEELSLLKAGSGGAPLSDELALAVGRLGENIALQRAVIMAVPSDCHIGSYVHGSPPGPAAEGGARLGRYGALVACRGGGAELGRRLAQHVVGEAPETLGTPEDLPGGGDTETRLLAQSLLSQPDRTVGQYLQENGAHVLDFVRFECGEAKP